MFHFIQRTFLYERWHVSNLHPCGQNNEGLPSVLEAFILRALVHSKVKTMFYHLMRHKPVTWSATSEIDVLGFVFPNISSITKPVNTYIHIVESSIIRSRDAGTGCLPQDFKHKQTSCVWQPCFGIQLHSPALSLLLNLCKFFINHVDFLLMMQCEVAKSKYYFHVLVNVTYFEHSRCWRSKGNMDHHGKHKYDHHIVES